MGVDPLEAADLLGQVAPGGKVRVKRDAKAEPPPCPVLEIVELYNEILPMCPQVRVFADAKRKQLVTRWREDAKRQNLAWWRGFFEHVRDECPFLVGKTRHGFLADLAWLIGPINFAKVINGNYAPRAQSEGNR